MRKGKKQKHLSEQNPVLSGRQAWLWEGAQKDSPGKCTHVHGRGGCFNSMESQYTTHTGGKKRDGWESPGFRICRALSSDCLFPSKYFGVGGNTSTRRAGGYGTVQATQTNPNSNWEEFNNRSQIVTVEGFGLRQTTTFVVFILSDAHLIGSSFCLHLTGLGLWGCRRNNISYASACRLSCLYQINKVETTVV